MSNRAWVTLATNDSYGLGALVLAHSLRRVGSTHATVVLITPSVTDAMRERLRAVFTEVVTVDVLDSRDAAHLALLQRPELGITFTKIHCWGLTQYEKCVFLDADTLVIQNCDELFEREELSAAPDVGWPDCFNSGVFVYKPSAETFDALIKFAQERGSFDGGDQGLLNSFFSDWARGDINKHLPFLYNVTSAAFYSYIPALKHYGQDLKIIHFIGAAKPWLQRYDWQSRSVDAPEHLKGLLQLWWDLFVGQVHHQLDSTMDEDVEVEAPPALPPPDVAQHYAPEPDPQSEFRWHHPDAQVQEEAQAEKLDTTQFYDPWQHYRGNIPPNPNTEASDERQAVRDYAWDYKAPAQWQPPGYQHDTHWHHDEPHQTHSHDHRDHNLGDHSHIHSHDQFHTHQTDEHHGWYQEHEAGQFFTRHNSAQHDHSEHRHDQHRHSHTQYPHDHHSDHTGHHYHDHNHFEQPQRHESSKDTQVHEDIRHTPVEYITNISRVHIVHHVHVDYENTPKDEMEEAKGPVTIKDMNGDASGNESCDHEDIRPRHPYDNYYLRHRATIDSYGRKICSHEIPPSPSPTPTPDSLSTLDSEEEDEPPEGENQSGVAGNLARVVPGATACEALDELTRRQGWEAGNIDYLGADSFDNIWAKISQTLNRPRTSPPKEPSPPKQTSPPKEPAPEQPSSLKEAPVELKPAEAPEEKPAEAPEEKPAEVPAAELVTEAAGNQTPVSPSVEVPAPVEAPAPVEPSAAVEAAAPAPAAETPALAAKAPAPVAEVPTAPVVTEAPAPAEAAAPAVEPPKEKSKEKTDETPVPPTPPATPKSTPEPSTPVAEVPSVVEALLSKEVPAAIVEPSSPTLAAEAPASPAAPVAATPEKTLDASLASSDSPPLANTPSKEEASATPAAKSEERSRKKPAGRLQLSPPAAADPLATPDSELEDAAALAQSIIAAELAPAAAPAPPVSLAQIGVKPKGKASTAARIESSVVEPAATPVTPAAEAPATPSAKTPVTPSAKTPATPSAETPATPSAKKPAIPSAETPAAPSAKKPVTPSAETPATPSAETPTTPSAKKPATPSAKKPATPTAETPATPSVEAPATPSAETPATPSAKKPATPSAKKPATPSAETPATPSAEAPATPSAEAPATPSVEAPATPSAEAPATPSSEAPDTPSAEAPATPTTPGAEASPKDAPKKKTVKKVVKKEGDAPVPPPRKKEKKPKEK